MRLNGNAARQHGSGRLRAAFLYPGVIVMLALLAGCASSSGNTPLLASLKALFPMGEVTETAERLPYASLKMTVEGNGGLWVLASRSGETTYWQSRDATVALHHGYLDRSAGIEVDLLDTQLDAGSAGALPWQTGAAPAPDSATQQRYALTRTWRNAQGSLVQQRADATLVCAAAPRPVDLPLLTVDLQRCDETLHWQDGSTTHGTLWRSLADGRLWAMTSRAWPDGPEIAWQVARPWWPVDPP